MTRKEMILRLMSKLPDDVTYDRVIYHLGVTREIEISLEQAERGEVIDHDDLMAELEAKDAQDEAGVVAASQRTSGRNRTAHRSRFATKSEVIRKAAKPGARKAKKVS
jgi:hypothetical protein